MPAAHATPSAPPLLLREARLLDGTAPVDLRLEGGRIAEISALGERLARQGGEEVLEVHGALAIPGLWDQHVHVGQTAAGYSRLDTSGVVSVDDMVRTVREALQARDRDLSRTFPGEALVGIGHRLVDMWGHPTVAALDDVSGSVPIVLIGGDAHHAWMNSAALRGLGLPHREGIVAEAEWFEAVAHLSDLPGVSAGIEHGVAQLQADALARGIVGLRDFEWARTWGQWEARSPRIRVRTATYASDLEAVPGPTGTPIGSSGLAEMGPLKVILDGSLGSRSAYCRQTYLDPSGLPGHGTLNLPPEELRAQLRRAQELGLTAAVHAIGDAAVAVALEALRDVGISATIEHAQMLADADIALMARSGAIASVQPLHVAADRGPTHEVWPEQEEQAYRFGDLLRAGVPLAFGSDAPVTPMDPWAAMAAAVHRSDDDRPAWLPQQAIQPRQALASSTDGVAALEAGGRADLVLIEEDVFAPVPTMRKAGGGSVLDDAPAREAAGGLAAVRPLATLVAGRLAFSR